MRKIQVETSRRYDVLMNSGLLKDAGKLIQEIGRGEKICLVSDINVYEIFGETLVNSLEHSGFEVYKILFPPGEKTKSIFCLERILEYMAENEFSGTDLLVGLGGGVIGDLTGFAAATFLRGIDFVQIPTTLLAAVDSSIGGKTAINLKSGKNLAGAFYQPALVLFDSDTLITLPNDRYKDGMSEIIKSAMIADREFFEFIAAENIRSRQFITECITKAINIKSKIVKADEKDRGIRKLLNFGHTMAHAIESCSGYKISHGHAVAIGMTACARASEKLEWIKRPSSQRLSQVLEDYGINPSCPFQAHELTKAALRDKKRHGKTISLIIPLQIGECAIKEIPIENLEEFFRIGLEKYTDI